MSNFANFFNVDVNVFFFSNFSNFKSSKTTPESDKNSEKSQISENSVKVPEIPIPITQPIHQPHHVANEFRIESVLDLQETPTYSEEARVQPEESHLNLNLPIDHQNSHQLEVVNHQDQYQPSLLPDSLNPVNLINNNTPSTSYNALAIPTPTASTFNYETHHFNYDTTSTNYLPSNSFNFIDFSKPTSAVVPQSNPQLPLINQNFDFTKMLPPPLPTNNVNFITGGLDFSKNSLNGQPTYIDY